MDTNVWFSVILSAHVVVGLAIIGLVLMQHGKGADAGAAFGGGASGSVFGSSGSANFLSRTTAVLATVFFLTSLGLSYMAGIKPEVPSSVMEDAVAPVDDIPRPAAPSVPAAGADSVPVPAPAGAGQ